MNRLNESYFNENPNKIVKFIYKITRFLFGYNPPPDWVSTPHNKSFINDLDFKTGYSIACQNIGEDYKIPWRVHQAIWCANYALKLPGDFVELGTGKGFIMQSVLGSISNWNTINRKLWLYDTFVKYSISGKGKAIHDHYYASDIDSVKRSFSKWSNILFIEGDIVKTISSNKPDKIAFLHVDLNDGDLEVNLIQKILPHMVNGGIILLDDYANRGEEDAYKLHNKFFSSIDYKILTTPSGQGIVIVRS